MVLLTKTNRSEEMLKRMNDELQAHRYYYKAMNELVRYIECWDIGTLRGKLKAILEHFTTFFGNEPCWITFELGGGFVAHLENPVANEETWETYLDLLQCADDLVNEAKAKNELEQIKGLIISEIDTSEDSRQQLHIHTEESLEPFYVIPKEVWYKDVA